MTHPPADSFLAYCRPGFEGDLASELTSRLGELGHGSYCRAKDGAAYVTCHLVDADAVEPWQTLPWRSLVFARQLSLLLTHIQGLPDADRAGPIAAATADQLGAVSDLWLEYPDTNEGKQLSRFCRRFRKPIRHALGDHGVELDVADAPRLHLFFTDASNVRIAISKPQNSAPWPLGIPRLRMPRSAPSRSTLKLDEAWQTFMDEREREAWVRPGMTAVDLGAAPGGWSWQLAQRSLRVTAVDNGPIDPALLATGLIEHVQADAFYYRPKQPVDWLVCDVVEQPHRVARLLAQWLTRGDCGALIANLKLPMKQRLTSVTDALSQLQQAVPKHGRRLGAKQLYHDREEMTVFVPPALPAVGNK